MKITFFLLRATVVASLASSITANAAEYGSSQYLPGFYGDFGMATTSASGTYLSNFFGYNWAENKTDESTLVFELPGVMHVSETKILGGTYSAGFFPYVLRSTYTTKNDGIKREMERGGAGDMYGVPISLAWQWQELSFVAFEGIVVPTGAYDKDRFLNAGRNTWTFDNNFGVTWNPDDGKYDFSMMFGYMVNTENNATKYRTGDEVHVDYSAGYYVLPSLGIGVTGSYYRQVTADSGTGVPADAINGEYSSIGPVVTYTVKMGDRDISFSAKWLHEYDVNNHIAGDYAILRTGLKF
ncbi:MAG: transporter [Methylococcaceae bacterium]